MRPLATALWVLFLLACDPRKERQDKVRTSAEVIDVTAVELQRAYDANEVAADQRYRDRVLRVTGAVESINKDIGDRPYLVLRAKDLAGVHAQFDDERGLASLRKRQQVTFRCVGGGYVLGSPILKSCVDEATETIDDKGRRREERVQAWLEQLRAVRADVCRCATMTCIEQLMPRVDAWADAGKGLDLTPLERDQVTAERDALKACVTASGAK